MTAVSDPPYSESDHRPTMGTHGSPAWAISRPGPGQVIDDKLDAAPDPPGWWCRPPRCSIVPATARGMAAIGEDGEGQGAVISTGQTAVRRAISPGNEGSLTVTRGQPRSAGQAAQQRGSRRFPS